jgi:hypothetical protein
MQRADEPLTKITLNIYAKDLEFLRRKFGWGWSEVVRGWIREKLRKDEHEYDRRVDR